MSFYCSRFCHLQCYVSIIYNYNFYNLILTFRIGKIKQITYLAVKERAISKYEQESKELKFQNQKLLILINKFKDENNRLIERLKKDMEEIQTMRENTAQWKQINEQIHKLSQENNDIKIKEVNERLKERKANKIFEIFRDIANSSTNLLKSKTENPETEKFLNVVTTEELEIIKGCSWK